MLRQSIGDLGGETPSADAVAANPFQCSSCGQSFSRVDHLGRHVRSHKKERPFICPKCSKSFGRIDLMKRHVDSKTCEASPSSKRRRIARPGDRVGQACLNCATDHLRCDDLKPCSRCTKKNLECIEGSSISELRTRDTRVGNLTDVGAQVITPLTDSLIAATPSFNPDNDNSTQSAAPGQDGGAIFHPPIDASQQQDRVDNHTQQMNPTSIYGNADDYGVTGGVYSMENDFDVVQNLPSFLSTMFNTVPQQFGTGLGFLTPGGFLDRTALEFDNLDFELLGTYNEHIPFSIDQLEMQSLPMETTVQEPSPRNPGLSAQAFQRSVWRFTPRAEDKESVVPTPQMLESLESDRLLQVIVDNRTTAEKLDGMTRDKILAIMFRVWNDDSMDAQPLKVLPSLELLDSLLQFYLTSKLANASSWIHVSSVYPLTHTRPELLLAMIAAGASLLPDLTLRKLGMALADAVRDYLPLCFLDNTRVRDLQSLQAFMLQLETAFWSGNSKRMELSESFLFPLVTMLRRGGKLRRSSYKVSEPSLGESEEALRLKHIAWIEQESWKRLVFRVVSHDTQHSMSRHRPPVISSAELLLPCPELSTRWKASTPSGWVKTYELTQISTVSLPCLPELLNEGGFRQDWYGGIDIDEASRILVHGYWRLVHHFLEWNVIFHEAGSHITNVVGPRYQELARMLESTRMRLEDMQMLHTSHGLLFELVLLNLNMPLEDVQLFAGLEGASEAQRVYPILQSWLKTSRCRQAVWHAGQIIRIVESMPRQSIREFIAVVVYQAVLALWAYGLLQRSLARKENPEQPAASERVILNGSETMQVKRFIALDRGTPTIVHNAVDSIPLINTQQVIERILKLLTDNHDGIKGAEPPLLESLMILMSSLGSV